MVKAEFVITFYAKIITSDWDVCGHSILHYHWFFYDHCRLHRHIASLVCLTVVDFPLLCCHVTIHIDEEMADKEESERTIAEDLVVTKYKMAADIVNRK
jgi:hypothetical protein